MLILIKIWRLINRFNLFNLNQILINLSNAFDLIMANTIFVTFEIICFLKFGVIESKQNYIAERVYILIKKVMEKEPTSRK